MASTSKTAEKDETAYDPEIANNISPEPSDSEDADDSDEEVDLEAGVHVNSKPEGRQWYNSLALSYFPFEAKWIETPPTSNENIKGSCNKCQRNVSGRTSSTSNWISHLKVKLLKYSL